MMSLARRWMRCVRPIAWTCRSLQQGRSVDCSASSSTPMMEGPGTDSEEKHEPVSDIDTAVVVVGLKALDPEWPIREAVDPVADLQFWMGMAKLSVTDPAIVMLRLQCRCGHRTAE